MSTPADEPRHNAPQHQSSDDGTVVGEDQQQHHHQAHQARNRSHLGLDTDYPGSDANMSIRSPSQSREQASRLQDDLEVLQIERQVSKQAESEDHDAERSLYRSRSRLEEPVDEFDAATNPLHMSAAIYKPPDNPSTSAAKFFKKLHTSSFLVRYLTYIVPLVLVILIPLLVGALKYKRSTVGGVRLVWFCIWLEIVWLTLWAGRILAKCLPYPIGVIASLFTNNSKKWRDMGKQLELPATLFFWWLAIEVSFLPIMKSKHLDGNTATREWERTMNKVLVAIFVGMILNLVEKVIIQLIAMSFHLRTYQDRIELNKFQIQSLVKLYTFSRKKIAMDDHEFEEKQGQTSGALTPGFLVKEAQRQTKDALNKVGDIAGKIAGDFTGRQIARSTHPHQVVLTLLSTTRGSQVLARRLYRTFGREDTETVHEEDLKDAFENQDEADAAFQMFDKDMNGDISMEELEAVCVEIGRERKSITASLKDLDSVIRKLDNVLMFMVLVVTIVVLISLISTSASGVLTSLGSSLLALSWLFSTTATEFLQSIVFVFVKHPFDVGDRVSIYGNTGSAGLGDDYFVKEIALLYTEFKKMEGHVVQAPNSYLNTLFILNQRRSGGLAEAVPVVIKFGTTLEQIEALRTRLLEFVTAEKREYQANILTELRAVTEAHSITLNVIFFYKSNWQNELLRLQRRNKFICALMVTMQEVGIEGPRMRFPGQKESFPVYLQNVPHIGTPGTGHGGHPDNPQGWHNDASESRDPPFVAPMGENQSHHGLMNRPPSILRHGSRPRGESLAAMGRRVDFSLGMKDVAAMDMTGDVYEDRERDRAKLAIRITSPSRSQGQSARRSHETGRSSSLADTHGDHLSVTSAEGSEIRHRPSHRNRFFGRPRSSEPDPESAMADIPEGNVSDPHRIDARTGVVSPAAVRMSTDETIPRPPPPSGTFT